MLNPNAAQAYLQIDRRRYEALIERLVDEVKAVSPASPDINERALREYFAIAITKGADFAGIKLDELGNMSASEIAKAAEALPDKLTANSREAFAKAADQRPAQMQWNRLFPHGVDDITLPLTGDAKSVDDRIAAYIEDHNAMASARYEEAKAKNPRNAGKMIDQREIRRDPADPAKLQVVNPHKPIHPDGSKRWEPGQRLGAFLEARQEWALLDDFKLENSRKNVGTGGAEEREAQTREFMRRKSDIRADELTPQSLRIIISRDPQKVGEMSSGQHWESCMSECDSQGKRGMNFHYVPKDIEAGSLVAYLVSADDPQARYPIMRQLLKPYYNQTTGDTVLIPAKVYGAFSGGNSRTRQALHDTLNVFVRERINGGKSGEFGMDPHLYGDGQAGMVNLQAVWDEASIKRGLIKYHDSALQEYLTEIRSRDEIITTHQESIRTKQEIIDTSEPGDEPWKRAMQERRIQGLDKDVVALKKIETEVKSLKTKVNNLADPEVLAKGFYREARKTSPDSLPQPQAVLLAANSSEIVERHKAVQELVAEGKPAALMHYLEGQPLEERIALTLELAQKMPAGANVAAEMWAQYMRELPSVERQAADAARVMRDSMTPDSLKKAAADIIAEKLSQVPTSQQRIVSFEALVNQRQPVTLAAIHTMVQDIAQSPNPRARIDVGQLVLKAMLQLPSTPELAASKRDLMELIYPHVDHLPSDIERFKYAAEVLSFGDRTHEAELAISEEAIARAKQLFIEVVPSLEVRLSTEKDFFFEQDPHLRALYDGVQTSSHYSADPRFQQNLEHANAEGQRVLSLIADIRKGTDGVQSVSEAEKAATAWASDVRAIENPYSRLAVLHRSPSMLEDIGHVDGNTEVIKPWKQQVGLMYLEIADSLPQGTARTNAYQYAYDELQDPAAKALLEERLFALATDENNHLKSGERLGLAYKVMVLDSETGFDFGDPKMQRLGSIIYKHLDERMAYARPAERVSMLASTMVFAMPGGEIERETAIRLRQELEHMPLQDRRRAAFEVIQQYTEFRDHPMNHTVGDFGALAASQAKAVLNGEVYDPGAVMVVRSSEVAPEPATRATITPTESTARIPVSDASFQPPAPSQPLTISDAPIAQYEAPGKPVSTIPNGPKTPAATRAGAGAGLGLGLKGLRDRLGDDGSYEKAQHVGGKQLSTERQALAGDVASVATGAAELLPQIKGAVGVATKVGVRISPIVAAGAVYLEVQAANTAQDGRRGAGVMGGFVGGMGVGMATGAAVGSIGGPLGAAVGGIVAGFGAAYVGSEIGRTSQWGDQRQRDLDHKAQYALDQSVDVIAEIGRKRLRGEPWTDADKAAIRTIGGVMVEHINRMQVLDIPATDIDGRLRQQYQVQQTQHVIDYLNGKTERLPMASQQRDAHLISSIDVLLPALNDPKLGWKPWLHSGTGAVDRADVLRTLSEYGVALHTLDKDGRQGVTIDELTTVLKDLKVDQRGKVTPARGAAHVERAPEINDETHTNFQSTKGYARFKKAVEEKLPELETLGIAAAIGAEGKKLTIDDIEKTFKANGIRVSEVDRNLDGQITADEIVKVLQSRGIVGQASPQQPRDSGTIGRG
ncbi:MAG: hypothetical protein V4735_08850 [Pseudomonadota bacterium]